MKIIRSIIGVLLGYSIGLAAQGPIATVQRGPIISSGGGGTATTPGGSNTQVQFNNNGSFGGVTGVTSDGTNFTALAMKGQLSWATGAGAISQIMGPSDQQFRISSGTAQSFQLLVGGTAAVTLFGSGPNVDPSSTGVTLGESSAPYASAFARRMQTSTGSTSLTLTDGGVGIAKITASASAPGAGGGKLELVCGSNAGTAALVIYAGTSATALTVINNIGSGVTGC